MKFWYFLGFLLMSIANTSLAAPLGNEDAGGGDAVYVEDLGIYVLLDYHIGIRLGYIKDDDSLIIAMGEPYSEEPAIKVMRVLDRIERFNPRLAQRAHQILRQFTLHMNLEDKAIEPISDENLEVTLEPNEILFQIARWERVKGTEDQIQWFINGDAWDSMDYIEQAGLMLHEIFYVLHYLDTPKEKRKDMNSRNVREFVAKISTREFTRYTDREWRAMMKDLKLFKL